MIIKRLLWLLIVVTTAIFSIAYLTMQAYWLSIGSFTFGAIWLALEIRNKQTSASLFFLIFLGLAVYGSLQNLPAPLMLVAISTDLAAWDLSRFRLRIKDEADSDSKSALEKAHLQKLGMTVGAGLIVGLVPLMVRLPLNFVALACLVLLAMVVLRWSVLTLRREDRNR